MKSLLDFLGGVIQLLTLQTASSNSKEEQKTATDAKDAYKWLLSEIENTNSTRAEFVKTPYLEPGKMYVFKYTPLYKNELDFWDKHPIVLSLGNIEGAKGKICLGVNISWYPPTARKFIVEKIQSLYKPKFDSAILQKPFKALKQKPIDIDVHALKKSLDKLGFSFALRQYIPERMQSPKICICYEDWDKAIRLDQPKIFPELQINNPQYSLKNIYESFRVYVQHQRGDKIKIKKDKNLQLK